MMNYFEKKSLTPSLRETRCPTRLSPDSPLLLPFQIPSPPEAGRRRWGRRCCWRRSPACTGRRRCRTWSPWTGSTSCSTAGGATSSTSPSSNPSPSPYTFLRFYHDCFFISCYWWVLRWLTMMVSCRLGCVWCLWWCRECWGHCDGWWLQWHCACACNVPFSMLVGWKKSASTVLC